MFNLKPSELYPKSWSEDRQILKTKSGFWELREYYGEDHHLIFSKWEFNKERNGSIWQKKICIPLNWYAFYLHFIYSHTGKCHKDLRSKFYIGKARERR